MPLLCAASFRALPSTPGSKESSIVSLASDGVDTSPACSVFEKMRLDDMSRRRSLPSARLISSCPARHLPSQSNHARS
jgi:hypothetical protein